MNRNLPLTVFALMLTGCGESVPSTLVEPIPLFSSAPTVTTGPFYAVAGCQADIGFAIRFGGDRVLMTHTTMDQQGRTHQTLHFRAGEFMGWRTLVGSPPATGPDYAVQGGAEMFSTHRAADGSIMVQIHQGNLVFVDLVTGQRVIAHHTIRQVPGQATQNYWSCRLVG